MSRVASPFDIKSASITGLALVLRTTDMESIEAELASRVRDAGDLFSNAPVLVDVSALMAHETAGQLTLAPLVELLGRHTMRAVGIVGATGTLLAQALALGLAEEVAIRPRQRRTTTPQAEPIPGNATEVQTDAAKQDNDAGTGKDGIGGQETLFENQPKPTASKPTDALAASQFQATVQAAVDNAVAGLQAPTLVIDKPLRSGQRVYARGGDLVVLGVVSHGAEVIADGNIHVYGPLRGRAIAGASGDADARIFAAAMEPELISIAGTYRTTDKPLEENVLGKPAQARLDGEKLLIEPLKN